MQVMERFFDQEGELPESIGLNLLERISVVNWQSIFYCGQLLHYITAHRVIVSSALITAMCNFINEFYSQTRANVALTSVDFSFFFRILKKCPEVPTAKLGQLFDTFLAQLLLSRSHGMEFCVVVLTHLPDRLPQLASVLDDNDLAEIMPYVNNDSLIYAVNRIRKLSGVFEK
jgi:hypothetical protein